MSLTEQEILGTYASLTKVDVRWPSANRYLYVIQCSEVNHATSDTQIWNVNCKQHVNQRMKVNQEYLVREP